MRISIKYGSHLPVLMKLLPITSGEVLELGMGVYSTPYLHWQCLLSGRILTSFDDDPRWIEWAQELRCPNHYIIQVEDWDRQVIERHCDIAFIDHTDKRRKIDIMRLANYARYIVVHDTNGKYENVYGFSEIQGQFKYRKVFTYLNRHTDVLSNFEDLSDL